jgi:hypothetical protein
MRKTYVMRSLAAICLTAVFLAACPESPSPNGDGNEDNNEELRSATIDDVTVAGVKGSYMNRSAVLELRGAEFAGITADSGGTDVSSWFTNLPAGLSVRVAGLRLKNGTFWILDINIFGTPTTALAASPIKITIPAANISGGSPLVVTSNPNAKFYISESAVTLSGSIDLRLNGSQYDEGSLANNRYGRLRFYASPNRDTSSIATTQISPEGKWDVSVPSGLTIYAFVFMDPMGTESLPVGQREPSDTGSWDMGTYNYVSISGTLSVTIGGAPFVPNQSQNNYLCVTAAESTKPNVNQIGGGYSIYETDGAWRIILPAVTGPRTISLRVFVFGPGISYSNYNVWTGQVDDDTPPPIKLTVAF